MGIGILACSALADYVRAAQDAMKTDYPVVEIDRNYHDRPKKLRRLVEEGLAKFPEEVDTILIAMGCCGNCWAGMQWHTRLVIPRMDDCVTILLHTDDEWHPNLKKPGHFYYIDKESDHFSLTAMYEKNLARYGERKAERLKNTLFGNYTNVDIVDTGVFDCYSEEYVKRVARDAELIHVPLDYVEGSNRILEKLISGDWDEQFIVAEPGTMIESEEFLELPAPGLWLEQ